MQYLSVCSMAAQNPILSYADIAKMLKIKEDDVEEWIITAFES